MTDADREEIRQTLVEAKLLMVDDGGPIHPVYAPTVNRIENAIKRLEDTND